VGVGSRGSGPEGVIYCDTHSLLWLRSGDLAWLSKSARRMLEESEALISPMVLLELQTLYEIQRIREAPSRIVQGLRADLGLRVCELPWSVVVERAVEIDWTRDPFDRMIVAHADARSAPLLTADEKIASHYQRALR
jgi:PIN domain nuclease of toxin-antitoxin system